MISIKDWRKKHLGQAPMWQKRTLAFLAGSAAGGGLYLIGAPQPLVTGAAAGVAAAVLITLGRNDTSAN
jgi:hypothetical protein